MGKIYTLLLLLFVLNYVTPECDKESDTSFDKKTCWNMKLSEKDKSKDELGYNPDTCCYVKSTYKVDGKSGENYECVAIKKKEVKKYIKEYDKGEEGITDVDISIDCSSTYQYIKLVLISLLLILN